MRRGDVHEQVGVGLLARALGAVALGIGHAGADDDVVALGMAHELEVALVVAGAVRGIDVVGDRVQHADRVEPGTTLEAGARQLPEAALHAVLHDQVGRRPDDVEEAVDPRPDQLRPCRRQFGILDREVVGPRQCVDRRADDRVVDRLLDDAAEQVDLDVAAAQRRDIFVAGADRLEPRPAALRRLLAGVQIRCVHGVVLSLTAPSTLLRRPRRLPISTLRSGGSACGGSPAHHRPTSPECAR